MKLTKAQRDELRQQRAKLTNPIDRIAFDNRWIGGVPVGLWLMVDENVTTGADLDAGRAALAEEKSS